MFVTIFRLANKQIYEELTPRIIDVDSEYPDMRAALFFEADWIAGQTSLCDR